MIATNTLQNTPEIAPRKRKRQPYRFTDRSGNALVHVPLTGGAVAIVDAEDFDRLELMGFTGPWFLNSDGKGSAYVRTMLPGIGGNLGMVSRLILDTPRGKVIRYSDRNPLNLRRDNLVFDAGFSKQREKDAKAEAPTAWPAENEASEGFIF